MWLGLLIALRLPRLGLLVLIWTGLIGAGPRGIGLLPRAGRLLALLALFALLRLGALCRSCGGLR